MKLKNATTRTIHKAWAGAVNVPPGGVIDAPSTPNCVGYLLQIGFEKVKADSRHTTRAEPKVEELELKEPAESPPLVKTAKVTRKKTARKKKTTKKKTARD